MHLLREHARVGEGEVAQDRGVALATGLQRGVEEEEAS